MNVTEIAVIKPSGRLDAAGAPGLESELQRRIADGQNRLVVDLSRVSYISSNGLRALLAALKAAQRNGGSLKLCCLNARLSEIFEMVGFDRVFEIYTNLGDAELSWEGKR